MLLLASTIVLPGTVIASGGGGEEPIGIDTCLIVVFSIISIARAIAVLLFIRAPVMGKEHGKHGEGGHGGH
ncbi:MAG: hypothetical protein V1796_01765 [Pseudomonadota bacterium]